MTIEVDLIEKLHNLARTKKLLVASDYDGTLAPIVLTPEKAFPHPRAISVLEGLTQLKDTQVAVVSGRSLEQLRKFCESSYPIELVGSHGIEFAEGFIVQLSEQDQINKKDLVEKIRGFISPADGFTLELKPAGLAIHFREVVHQEKVLFAEIGLENILSNSNYKIHRKNGKMVWEFSLVKSSKAMAIEKLKNDMQADAVLFMGDDLTDEEGFAILSSTDLGVKVGPGVSLAHKRVEDPDEAIEVLRLLLEARSLVQAQFS